MTSPARVLHPWRRRAAHWVARRRAPRSVLVVCYGNICRSPVAAALLRQTLGPVGIRVESGGLIRSSRRSPAAAIAAAARRGVDLTQHRAKLVTAERVCMADLIVVMDAIQCREIRDRFGRARRDVVLLGDFDPLSIDTRAIRDPLEQPAEVFDETYARIARCTRALGRAISRGARPPLVNRP